MNDNDYERKFCQKCDVYRGYTCAEHREPNYESLKEALSGIALCGHENRFTEWEDHSKPISCVKCKLAAAEDERDALRTTLHGAHELLAVVIDDLAGAAKGGGA